MRLKNSSRISLTIIVCFTALVIMMWVNYSRMDDRANKMEEEINVLHQDPLERSFLAFQKMSGEDLHILWHKKFYDSKYVLDCKIQYNQYNCSTAVIAMLIDLGANIDHKDEKGNYINVTGLREILVEHSYKITRLSNIRGKEIVIFKHNGRGYAHAAMVERVMPNKEIMIMEVTSLSGGVNYRTVSLNDKRIEGVYPVTRGLWQGNSKK